MHKLIAVLGGDARYLEMIRQIRSLPNCTIVLVGFDQIEQNDANLRKFQFHELEPENLDIIILPPSGTDLEGNVETTFSREAIQINRKWFNRLKKTAIIFTGITNNFLTSISEETGIRIIPLMDRDDIAIYNSIPTAEGTIMLAMDNTDYTIHSSNVTVVGFGRIGQTIANKFAALGANVSVSSQDPKDLARITEMGLTAVPIYRLHKTLNNCDILINTVPALVIDQQKIKQLPIHSLIIDLASKPGGTDFDYAKKRGVQAILAKSLPGIVAPKTAGKILAEGIIDYLQTEINDLGEDQ